MSLPTSQTIVFHICHDLFFEVLQVLFQDTANISLRIRESKSHTLYYSKKKKTNSRFDNINKGFLCSHLIGISLYFHIFKMS